MAYIQPMKCKEFAEYVLAMETGDFVAFACEPGVDWPHETPNVDSVGWWFFIEVMDIPQCDSEVIFMDFFGGGSPFVCPTKHYCKEHEIVEYVTKYLMEYCEGINSMDDYVFVEMEE